MGRLPDNSAVAGLPPASTDQQAAAWYVARTRSRHEKLVAGQWRQAGLDFWLPLLSLRRRWSDRDVYIEEPLFAGYLFLHGDGKAREVAVRARGVVQFVGFGGGPTPVPDEEIIGVREALESGLRCDPCPYMKVGQEVEVIRGPLRGQRGIIDSKQGSHWLVLSVHLIGRSVAVEMSSADVRPY